MAFATRSEIKWPPTRSSEPSHPSVKLPPTTLTGKMRSSFRDQGLQCPLPNLARTGSLFEQALYPKPTETLVRAVPMRGIPVKAVPVRMSQRSMPYRQAISARSSSRTDITRCAAHTSEGSFDISSTVVKVSGHSPNLRESDGAIPWTTLMYECKGFEWKARWTVDVCKACLECGTNNIRCEHCFDESNQIQYMRLVHGH